MPSSRQLDRNPLLLCAFHALMMSLFPLAVLTLFFRDELGMDLVGIMSVQAVFGLIMAALEFPSGYVADRLGYRKTLIGASCIVAAGWTLYALAQGLVGVVLAEVVLGAGFSLISGTSSALLYESLHARGREQEFARWFGRMRFGGQVAEGTSALLAGAMYAFWARLPFVAMVPVWLVCAVLAARMVEAPRGSVEQAIAHWARMKAIVRHATQESPVLRSVMLLGIVLGLSSFIPVWLIQLYAVDAGVDVAYLGLLWAAANYAVALGALWADRLRQTFRLLPTLAGCVLLMALGYAGLGLSTGASGVAFYFAITLMRGINGTLLQHEEHKLIPSADRASFVSLRSLGFRASFVASGPLIGAAADLHGQHATLLWTGAVLVVLSAFAWISFARNCAAARPPIRHSAAG